MIDGNQNIDEFISTKLTKMQLVDLRKAKHLTQKQMSEISGLSTSCISNIESGENNSPTLRSLIRYASALDVNIFIGKDENINLLSKEQ